MVSLEIGALRFESRPSPINTDALNPFSHSPSVLCSAIEDRRRRAPPAKCQLLKHPRRSPSSSLLSRLRLREAIATSPESPKRLC